MKIGFFGESPGDQAALAIFAEGIRREPPEPINMDLQAHGVSGVLNALDGVYRGLHYNSDAEALVVVVDCDDEEMHEASHDAADGAKQDCRLCQIRKIIARARNQLKPRKTGPELKVAIGLAVPAIEAWYLVGRPHQGHQVGEAAWKSAPKRGRGYRMELKRLVYETDRPSLDAEIARASNEARRLIGNLNALESAFPIGFGLMAEEIRKWK